MGRLRDVMADIKEAKKISAADIEALRWREMFQAALTGMIRESPGDAKMQEIVKWSASAADLGLREFYARYAKETR